MNAAFDNAIKWGSFENDSRNRPVLLFFVSRISTPWTIARYGECASLTDGQFLAPKGGNIVGKIVHYLIGEP